MQPITLTKYCIVTIYIIVVTVSTTSMAQNDLTTTGPDGTSKRAPIKKMFTKEGCWGFIVEVLSAEQGIFASSEISCGATKPPPADNTKVNVIRRHPADLIEYGIGTSLQILMVDAEKNCASTLPGSKQGSTTLLGCAGSTITIQPGASVNWNGTNLAPTDQKAITLKFVYIDGKISIVETQKISVGSFSLEVPKRWVGFNTSEAEVLRREYLKQSKQIYQQYSGSGDSSKSVDIAAYQISNGEGNFAIVSLSVPPQSNLIEVLKSQVDDKMIYGIQQGFIREYLGLVPVDKSPLVGFYTKAIGKNGNFEVSVGLEHNDLKNSILQLTLSAPKDWDEKKATTALELVLKSVTLNIEFGSSHNIGFSTLEGGMDAKEWYDRVAAVEKLTDQTLLAKIAVEDKHRWVRVAAVERLTDQTLLAKIAVEDKDWAVRKATVERLTNQTLLTKIAIEDEDRTVRKAASAKVTDLTLKIKIINDAWARIQREGTVTGQQ